MKPKTAEYDIGRDTYGRSATLIMKNGSNGKTYWDLRIDPASQRDSGETITGLSDDNLVKIGEVINQSKHGFAVMRAGKKGDEENA